MLVTSQLVYSLNYIKTQENGSTERDRADLAAVLVA
jgi:hypothetical protein